MDFTAVALPFVLACALATVTAENGVAKSENPNDDHVIITQYGPLRYDPVTVDELNRPYGGGPPRGYYKAEVIPLDMNTWKPVLSPGGGTIARGETVRAAGGRVDTFDVPLKVGYSVRPTTTVRQRRHDYLLVGHLPPLAKYHHKYPEVRSATRPMAAAGLWTF